MGSSAKSPQTAASQSGAVPSPPEAEVRTARRPAASDVLESPFVRLCGNCGYLLAGLPPQGICPECGQSYEVDEMVILGWFDGPHQSIATAPVRDIWRIVLFWTAVLWVQAVDNLMRRRTLAALGWGAAGAAIVGWSLYRRYTLMQDKGCPAQLRLSSRGMAQRAGFGPVAYVPWAPDLAIRFVPLRNNRHSFSASREGPKNRRYWPIAFEFECSVEQANRLRQIIQHFDSAARN